MEPVKDLDRCCDGRHPCDITPWLHIVIPNDLKADNVLQALLDSDLDRLYLHALERQDVWLQFLDATELGKYNWNASRRAADAAQHADASCVTRARAADATGRPVFSRLQRSA
jgi:hypothetical protein